MFLQSYSVETMFSIQFRALNLWWVDWSTAEGTTELFPFLSFSPRRLVSQDTPEKCGKLS